LMKYETEYGFSYVKTQLRLASLVYKKRKDAVAGRIRPL
jgi:hypothetical protein